MLFNTVFKKSNTLSKDFIILINNKESVHAN